MNTELLEALTILEEEKDISRDTLMDAIENSLINACKNHFGKADNIKVIMDKETCDYTLIQEKTVVEEVEDKVEQISLADAKMIDPSYEIGDIVQIPVESKSFGRIATQNAKNLILQKIREEERKVVYDQYFEKEKDIVTGVVQRYIGKNVSVNLGKAQICPAPVLTSGCVQNEFAFCCFQNTQHFFFILHFLTSHAFTHRDLFGRTQIITSVYSSYRSRSSATSSSDSSSAEYSSSEYSSS